METASGGLGALGETTVFLHHFKDMPDPRQRGKVSYPLDEGPTGPLTTGAGGAPAASPQGEAPGGMQAIPGGASDPKTAK